LGFETLKLDSDQFLDLEKVRLSLPARCSRLGKIFFPTAGSKRMSRMADVVCRSLSTDFLLAAGAKALSKGGLLRYSVSS